MFTVKDYTIKFIFLAMLQLGAATQLIFAQQPSRQTYTVRGEILSLVDGLPLANIRVALKGTDFQAVSNSAGVFEIKGVPAGTYDIIAKYPDFDATILKDVIVPPPAKKSFVFNLEPADGAKPLPYVDSPAPDSLGYLEGEIGVNIDAYSAALENGNLVLKAIVVADPRHSYFYPQEWKILPVSDQIFRFKFYLPKGKSYRLYLVWQETQEAFLFHRILDVIRAPENPKAALVFDLSAQSKISGIRYAFTKGV
jgi:hypothetical protein